MAKHPCVYMLASKQNGTLYMGVTSNLVKRVWQYKQGVIKGFSHKYGIHRLVDYELHQTMESAIIREKQMKKWNREWKINLIEKENSNWADLWGSIQ